MNRKGFYLLLHFITHKTLSLSPLDIILVNFKTNEVKKKYI